MRLVITYTIGSLVAICASMAFYMYLNARTVESNRLSDKLKFQFQKKHLILAVICMTVTIAILLYDNMRLHYPLLKIYLNEVMFVWVLAAGYIDLKEKIIPNQLIVVGLIIWLVVVMLEIFVGKSNPVSILKFSIIGALVCGGLLFLITIFVKTALGMGDAKMFTVLGLLYGLSNTYGILFFSIVIMALVSIVLLITKKANRKTRIPMAPFVVIGFLLGILGGI